MLKGITINESEPDIKKQMFKFKPMMTIFLLLSKNISKDKVFFTKILIFLIYSK